MCRCQPHIPGQAYNKPLFRIGEVLNQTQEKNADDLKFAINTRKIDSDSGTFVDHFSQSIPIIGIFGDRFAVVPRLPGPVIHSKSQMVRRDGACNRVAQ